MKVKIEKLVHGGQGLAHTSEGQAAFVWNALPDEEVEARIISKKHGVVEAIAETIYARSSHRQEPLESFYLSTAPWQIMDYEYENKMKSEIAQETYHHLGNIDQEIPAIHAHVQTTQYRNKMEYSFYFDDENFWHIGFFQRGSHRKQATGVSVLAQNAINSVAEAIIDAIRQANIPIKTLKSMILRTNNLGEVLYALFVKDEYVIDHLPLQQLSKIDHVIGCKVYYSRPQSPASTTDKLLFNSGENAITTKILKTNLQYGVMSFFQIHEPIFTDALNEISTHIDNGSNIVDYFSGVGAISIPLAKKISSAILIDSNSEAIDYATINIRNNNVDSVFRAICTPAEKANEYITNDKIIIFDPPRAGLHSDTVQTVLEVKPPKIIYMSCNIATHARDLGMLKESYNINKLKIYNFFPRTPHIEGLAILSLRK